MAVKSKNSRYLLEKLEALDKVISFFNQKEGGFCLGVNDKFLIFITQIDFWDWEIENVIFSFDNFEQRSKSWESMTAICESLGNKGLEAKNRTLQDAEQNILQRNRPYRAALDAEGYYNLEKVDNTLVVPWKELNDLISKWNKLLTKVENKVLNNCDLKKYAKKLRECMKKTFTDGTVELTMSGNTNPPGSPGQHGNVSSVWFRVNGGEWERGSSRVMHKHVEALECAESVADFRKYVEADKLVL